MLHRISVALAIIFLATSCFTDDVKKKMDTAIKESQDMFADQHFKSALYNIEMHKLRFGSYPSALRELKSLSVDSSFISSMEYQKLDSGYSLNYTGKYASLSGETDVTINLQYPDEFWQGLGCVKSNMKSEGQ